MLSKPMQPNSKSSDREWMRRSANAVKARKIGRRGRKPHEPSMRRTTSLRFREASTGSLSYFLGCLVPYHGGPTECIYLFLPPCHRPSPREVWVSFPLLSANTTSRGGVFSRLQTFLYVQASEFARLPGRSYRCAACRRAAETFTSGQNVLRCLCTHRIC